MVMITSVSIDSGTGFNAKTSEIKLASDKTSYERITVELTEEETAEVIQLVSEIIATRLRMPMIKEKLEAAKSVFPPPPTEMTSEHKPIAACVHGVPLTMTCSQCNPEDPVFPDAPNDDIPF